jgi:hypothetical protein
MTAKPSKSLHRMLSPTDIHAPLHRDQVMHRLKQHIAGYDKGARNSFALTCQNLAIALQRAERLAARFTARTDPEPFTAIVELVKLLTTLRA